LPHQSWYSPDDVRKWLEKAAAIAEQYKRDLGLPEECGDEVKYLPVAPIIANQIRMLKKKV
jgi:hypothetical protein